MRVNVKEAAAYVGLSITYMNQLRGRGGGPRYIKIAQRVIYDTTDLDAWLDAHKTSSTSETSAAKQRAKA